MSKVLEMLSPQGKAGERGLKGQKVRKPWWAWVGISSSQMPSLPSFPDCLVPALFSLPSPLAQRRALSTCRSQEGSLPPHGSPLPSLIPTPYRVTQEIREILECLAPRGSRDCRESLGFGAPWGQKDRRSVRRGQFVA